MLRVLGFRFRGAWGLKAQGSQVGALKTSRALRFRIESFGFTCLGSSLVESRSVEIIVWRTLSHKSRSPASASDGLFGRTAHRCYP